MTQTDSVLRRRASFQATNPVALMTDFDHIGDHFVRHALSQFGLELLKRGKTPHIPARGLALFTLDVQARWVTPASSRSTWCSYEDPAGHRRTP